MKIRVENPCSYKGDIYRFTFEFNDWLGGEITSRVEESEAFTKKYGKDWTLTFAWDTGQSIKQPELSGPWIDRKYKEMRCGIKLPYARHTSPGHKAYVPELKQFLAHLAGFLSHEQINTSKLEKDAEALLKDFVSRSGMLKHDPHPYTFGTPENPYGLKKKSVEFTKQKPKVPARFVKRNLPKWKVSKNIEKLVEKEGGMWEDERFDPILLTVMSGTSYEGRDIPLSWHVEFDPYDERFAAANEEIEETEIEPDGDGWSSVIEKKFADRYPKLIGEFHSDSESSTCVVWVETEDTCRKLIEVVWSLIYPK